MRKYITLQLLVLLLTASCAGGSKIEDQKHRLKYKNSRYSFSLQFPEKWTYYMDFEEKEIIDTGMIIPVIYFALPTKSREWQPANVPTGYGELFYVRVFTRDQWKIFEEKYKTEEKFPQNDKIFTTGKRFVYMIKYPVSLPVDLYHYMKESESIAGTFRITGE